MNDNQQMPQRVYICVYASSSCALDETYYDAANRLGTQIARQGYSLVFGAGGDGLMGTLACAVHEAGGSVVGVLPEVLNVDGVAYPNCDQLHVTKSMRERKQMMEEYACGFIALPGGYGTLEELLEIITLKQLRYHNKPIVLVNTDGFYAPLIDQFEKIISGRFAKEASRLLYTVCDTPEEAVSAVASYVPTPIAPKWASHVPCATESGGTRQMNPAGRKTPHENEA